MQRNTATFPVTDFEYFKKQMLNWANRFSICCFLDNHQYNHRYHSYECILAADANYIFSPQKNILHELHLFTKHHKDWLFGHISYDIKNETEALPSFNEDHLFFPDIFLFQPETVITLNKNEATISCISKNPSEIFAEIKSFSSISSDEKHHSVNIKARINKEDYLSIIQKLQAHILRGDCYEINFCQEFFSENAHINPLKIYQKLSEISPAPFAAFYKLDDKYVLCASPERYLKKTGNEIISQPIKGTYKRNAADIVKDKRLEKELFSDAKERSENVMIADLVRNDLSKICKEGSVFAEELFGIYTFPQVHQMISTIKGKLKDEIDFSGVLKATFPMGSMTGAPKKRVLQLIEKYEWTKRGIYSGCIGYITHENDFDFNVVIRSIMYNASKKYLSYQVGSGITFYSNAENEYEECLLKAEAIKKTLE